MLQLKQNKRFFRATPLPTKMLRSRNRVDKLIDSVDDVIYSDPEQPWLGEAAMLGMGGTVTNPATPTSNKGNNVIAGIKKAASLITPENIDKGTKLVESGKGLLTATQQAFGKGQTDPSRLPKTKDVKEAEQALLLPQTGAGNDVSDSFKFDSKWIWIGGGIIVGVLVIKFALKK